MKNQYAPPKVVSLGSAASETRSENSMNSDVEPFVANTAIPPPPPSGS